MAGKEDSKRGSGHYFRTSFPIYGCTDDIPNINMSSMSRQMLLYVSKLKSYLQRKKNSSSGTL